MNEAHLEYLFATSTAMMMDAWLVVGDWQQTFDDAATQTFMQHGGVLLKELGYE